MRRSRRAVRRANDGSGAGVHACSGSPRPAPGDLRGASLDSVRVPAPHTILNPGCAIHSCLQKTRPRFIKANRPPVQNPIALRATFRRQQARKQRRVAVGDGGRPLPPAYIRTSAFPAYYVARHIIICVSSARRSVRRVPGDRRPYRDPHRFGMRELLTKSKVIWMQLGVVHEQAAARALEAGLEVGDGSLRQN